MKNIWKIVLLLMCLAGAKPAMAQFNLKKAGKNPWAMALSFQKLKQMQEEAGAQKGSKLNQLFSTHPDLDLRIRRMEERTAKEGIIKPDASESKK